MGRIFQGRIVLAGPLVDDGSPVGVDSSLLHLKLPFQPVLEIAVPMHDILSLVQVLVPIGLRHSLQLDVGIVVGRLLRFYAVVFAFVTRSEGCVR